MRTASVAILMCAVMVLVIGAPLVTADTHHIVKGAQGPRASAVSWNVVPTDNGSWYGHIVNSGLRSLVVDVDDTTNGVPVSILHQRIRFAAYPTNVVDTSQAVLTAGKTYTVTATPNGPRGTFCDVDDMFVILHAPTASFTYTVDGATVSVDASTSTDSDGTIVAWGWEWGDGTVGSGMTAMHTYGTSGDYTIVLTVMDNDGLTNSTSHLVTVVVPDELPVAAFTWTVDGFIVSFDASTSTDDHGINDYSWQFGDQTTGNGMMVTHTYAAEGTYTVVLTVMDTIGQTNSISHDVLVSPMLDLPPVAIFTATPSGYSVSVDATLSTDDHGINSYSWNWGDGSPAGSGMTATHTYTNVPPLLKTIVLTVTDTVGQTASVSHDVTLQDSPPVAAFTASVSGYTVSVDATTSTDDHGVTSYAWNWGDGSPAGSGMTATHTYTNVPPLLKTIGLTVRDAVGQTASVSHDVTLQDNAPVAAFTLTKNLLVVNVDGSTSSDDHGIASWAWSWGDGSPAGSGMTATHTYGAAGTYTITLTVTDTVGQTASQAVPVDVTGGVVDTYPVASFTGVTASGGMLTLDASGSTDDHGIVSYDWNFGDHIIASGVNRVHKYVATGTYTVTLTVKDTIGQTSSLSKTFSVVNSALPPLPYTVYGFTYASDGTTPLVDATVTVTNVRTGETLIDIPLSDATGLYYVNDVMPLYFLTGDTMVMKGMGPSGQIGSTSVVLDLTGQPYLQVDITLV